MLSVLVTYIPMWFKTDNGNSIKTDNGYSDNINNDFLNYESLNRRALVASFPNCWVFLLFFPVSPMNTSFAWLKQPSSPLLANCS